MSRGVLIIATGHTNYYRMALNLAVSLKTVNRSTKIALACTENIQKIITMGESSFFDESIIIKESDLIVNGKLEHPTAKVMMYNLSPFDETIYIDADSLWLPKNKIEDLFALVEKNQVAFQSVHLHDLNTEWNCLWTAQDGGINTGIADIKNHYGLKKGTIHEMQSSFMYFKKGKKAEKFFKDAEDFYRNRPIFFHIWSGGMPDELAFNVSSAINQTKVTPHPLTPVYFADYDPNRYLMGRRRNEIFNDYYIVSMAGNQSPKSMVDMYDDVITEAYMYNQTRVRFAWKWQNKRQFSAERASI
jgi:hypothetical protein